MHARVLLRMGPVRARFTGKVKMTDIKPLQGYTLNFEGSGGSAGFAKGSSVITLTEVDGNTQLDYTAQASVAGKLGQIGGRLIDALSKQLADQFFANFKAAMAGEGVNTTTDTSPVTNASSTVASNRAAPPNDAASAASESTRLLWFFAGVAATSMGVWMGAHWLR